jgi:hypothetical protein
MNPSSDPSLPDHHDLLPPALRQRMRRFIVEEDDEPTVDTASSQSTMVTGEPVMPWAKEARTELGGAKSMRALRDSLCTPSHDDSEQPKPPPTLWERFAKRLGLPLGA